MIRVYKKWINLIAICFFSLNGTLYSQKSNIEFSQTQLEQFADKLIQEDPASAIIQLEDYSKKYKITNQLNNLFICKAMLAKALMENGQADEAMQLLSKLISDPQMENYTYPKIHINFLRGKIEFQNTHFYRATLNYRAALESAKMVSDNEWIAKINEELAKIFDKINRPDKAIQFYLRSLQLNSKINNNEGSHSCALALSRLYQEQEKLDSALYYSRMTISISKSLNNTALLIESLIEEASIYLKKREYQITSNYIQQINDLLKIKNNPNLEIRLYVLTGNYIMNTQGDSLAMDWYHKAEEHAGKGFNPFMNYFIKSNISNAYKSIGQIDKAYNYLKYSMQIGSVYNSKGTEGIAEDTKQDVELNLRDREIDFLRIQNQLKQEKLVKEIQLKEKLNRINILQNQSLKQESLLNEATAREKAMQLEQLEKEKIIRAALQKENVLKNESLEAEQKRQKLLWFGIILLLGFVSLILYLFNKQKEKNQIIIKQAKDLEFINKEVHHRVKNNLQVISSLLDLQAHSSDQTNVNMLTESKHRVQSMAFIHQNLYEGDGMNQVDMPNYVRNLVDHLYNAYHRDDQDIQIKTEIDEIRLHMDRVVSVGMIINELVTNSLKYAFIQKKKGIVTVKLKEIEKSLLLTVMDDGDGISELIDVYAVKSFGYKMIRSFVQKLKAKLTIENDHGTKVQILFDKKSSL